jgi:hypothetical protein
VGAGAEGAHPVDAQASLLENAWADGAGRSYGGVWAIVPFEDLTPRWKVLKVNGLSPLDPALVLRDYPLALWFGYSGSQAALNLLSASLGPQGSLFPPGNRELSKMTVLAMTGVTALARATASRMDLHGTTYPGRDIAEWLRNADLTHISNEVSFNPACPLANPMSTSMQFCSRPEYIELLDFIGTDIIELSGNHNNDYGREASTYSLELYAQRGWLVYAGGANAEEARQPRTIEHNGNRFAFIGCNPVGPPNAWATSDLPGAAKCDWGYMTENIQRLRAGGYLPIVTIQYNEYYIPRAVRDPGARLPPDERGRGGHRQRQPGPFSAKHGILWQRIHPLWAGQPVLRPDGYSRARYAPRVCRPARVLQRAAHQHRAADGHARRLCPPAPDDQ